MGCIRRFMLQRILLLALSIVLCNELMAQNKTMSVSGYVSDSTGRKPLLDAQVMAVRFRDSLLLDYTHTDAAGYFKLKPFQIDSFSLIVRYPLCDDKTYFIFGSLDNLVIDIPSIRMAPKTKELEEVVIYANKNPIYFKGDTLVYVADSFKVAENAVVEDLLKKLPGIKVDSDGKITSQGKEISQVLVDGDEFFGTDPTVATRNLGAKGVESVQVYEKKNENAKEGQDQTMQVMDLKLKEDAKKGYFGKFSGASDFGLIEQDRTFYEGELLLNKFDKTQKISVFALSSNTPKSNFNWGDMNKFGLDNERNSSGASMWNQRAGTTTNNGIPQTLKTGFYFSDKLGEKGKIAINYSFYQTKLSAYSSKRSQYFLQDSSYYTKDSTSDYTLNQSHRFNTTYTLKMDSLTTLELKPNITLSKADQENKSWSTFLTEDGISSFRSSISNESVSKGVSSNSEATLLKKFKVARRQLELKYKLNASDNATDGYLYNTNEYIQYGYSDTTDQSKKNSNSSVSHNNYVTYTEPLSGKIKLETEYLLEVSHNDQKRKSFNKVNNLYSEEVAALTNDFESKRTQHRLTVKGIYESRVHSASIGLGARSIQIDNSNLVLDTNILQSLYNILPNAFYQYKPSQSKRFSLTYFTNSFAPSLNDLQPVQDNTNPNRIQIGNPDLKPNYMHNLNGNFNMWNALTGRYIWSGLTSSLTNNAFANATSYDSLGRTVSITKNVNGNVYANVYAGAGYPILNRKLTFSPSMNVAYSKYTNFINNQENVTQNTSLGGGLEISLELDSLEFSLSNDYTYVNPVSTLNTVSNQPYTIQKYTAELDWTLPGHFKIKSDVNYTMNQNLSAAYNLNILLVNAEISRNFLPTENLIVALRGNDILNQNKNIQRQINGNVITDNYTRIISRYFLLRVTYKFNKNKTKEEDFHGWH